MAERLNNKRREIIRPVLEKPRDFVLLSVRELAKKLKTDPATTVRMVQGMGFRSYKDFQRHLHEISVANSTSLDMMQAGSSRETGIARLVSDSFEQDMNNLQGMHNNLDAQRIRDFAKRIYKARRILLLGGDLAASLVMYLEYHLMILGLPVFTATTPGRAVHVMRAVGKEDLALAISFRRGLRLAVEGLQQARANGAYTVGITDTFVSPIARFADECFISSVATTAFGASYVAPMALLNAILAGCASYKRKQTMRLLKQAEDEQRHGYRFYQS